MLGAINSARVNRIVIDGGYPAISELFLSKSQAAQELLAAGVSSITAVAVLSQSGNTLGSSGGPSVVAVLGTIQNGGTLFTVAALSTVAALNAIQSGNTILVVSKTKMENHADKMPINSHFSTGSMSKHVAVKRTLLRH